LCDRITIIQDHMIDLSHETGLVKFRSVLYKVVFMFIFTVTLMHSKYNTNTTSTPDNHTK